MRGHSVQALGVQVLGLSFCRGWTSSALCELDPFTGRGCPDGRPQPSWGSWGQDPGVWGSVGPLELPSWKKPRVWGGEDLGAGGLLQPFMGSDWPLQRLGPAAFSVAEEAPLDLMSQVQSLVPWDAGSRPVPGPSGEGAKASGHLDLGASRSGSGTARDPTGASCTCPGRMCTWPARGPPPPQGSQRTAARQAHPCLPRVWRASAAPRVGGGSTGERRGAEGPRGGWGGRGRAGAGGGLGSPTFWKRRARLALPPMLGEHVPGGLGGRVGEGWGSEPLEDFAAVRGGRALSGRPVCPSACTAAWGLLSAAGVGRTGSPSHLCPHLQRLPAVGGAGILKEGLCVCVCVRVRV